MNDFIDELVNLPSLSGGLRSPDGKWVMAFISGLHDNLEVYIIDAMTGNRVRMTNNSEVSWPVDWWPDSKSVIIAQDSDGNERTVLYRVFVDEPAVLHPLTRENPSYFMRVGDVSPDGKYLYYSVNYDFEKEEETETWALIRQDLESGELTELARSVKNSSLLAQLSPDGTKLLYSRADSDPAGRQVHIIDINGDNDREILNFGSKGYVYPIWHPNSKHIVFTTNYYEDKILTNRWVGIYTIENKKIKWINKPDDFAYESLLGKNITSAHISKYAPEMLRIYDENQAKDRTLLIRLGDNLEFEELIEIPVIRGNLSLSTRINDNLWIGSYYSSTTPSTLVTLKETQIKNLKFEDLNFIFDNFENSGIASSDLVPAEDYNWKSVDGQDIHGWLYKSKIPSDKLMVYVHGGPTSHSQDRLNTEIQYYIKEGFNVLDPNYRGSTGYGIEFQESIKEDGWGGKEQADIATGVESLINSGLVTKGKVGVTGTSYGGYSAYCAITMYPDVFEVAAPVCGMTDLVVDYYSTRPDLRPYSEQMMGGNPDEVPDRYKKGSPIHYIDQIKGKLLIVQGAKDPNVTMEKVKEEEIALRKNEIEYETLIFDDEGHGIIKKENRKRKIIQIASFAKDMIEDKN